MHIHEIDWRIGPLHDIIVGVDTSIAAIEERLHAEQGDGLVALEHVEPVLGLGFVAFQNYALGTWTDLNENRKNRRKPPITKLQCYACDSITLRGGPTRIEVINATANYFKHRDEWSGWPNNGTTRTLRRVGILQSTKFPCIEAARMFCGDRCELVVLHQIVQEWRAHVFKKLQ